VLMFHWDYNAEYAEADAQLLLDAGFEVVACPALVRSGTIFVPHTENLNNIRACAARSLPLRKKGLLGMVTTVWCPWRYLPGAIDYGVALAGRVSCGGEDHPRFAHGFAQRFYGLTTGSAVSEAIRAAHDCGADSRLMGRIVDTRDGFGSSFSREDVRRCRSLARGVDDAVRRLKKERSNVRRNRERYDDLVLSLEGFRALLRFAARGRQNGVPGTQRLPRRIEKAWSRDRHPDDLRRLDKMKIPSVRSVAQLASGATEL